MPALARTTHTRASRLVDRRRKPLWYARCIRLSAQLDRVAHAASAAPAGCKPITKLPTTINKGGDYCLTKSFKVRVPSGNAIEVTGDNIVIDLNGHTIANKSNGNTAVGVFAGQRSNVTVRNGTLVGFERAPGKLAHTHPVDPRFTHQPGVDRPTLLGPLFGIVLYAIKH